MHFPSLFICQRAGIVSICMDPFCVLNFCQRRTAKASEYPSAIDSLTVAEQNGSLQTDGIGLIWSASPRASENRTKLAVFIRPLVGEEKAGNRFGREHQEAFR